MFTNKHKPLLSDTDQEEKMHIENKYESTLIFIPTKN